MIFLFYRTPRDLCVKCWNTNCTIEIDIQKSVIVNKICGCTWWGNNVAKCLDCGTFEHDHFTDSRIVQKDLEEIRVDTVETKKGRDKENHLLW